ncbi:hypothetical protein KSS87_020405 [Heliosperma pusillum]|nr:hypothetical protein KSS87_020405 [Heliosperma pusillum]
MVGAFSLLGSPVIDSPNSCPCLCLDAMSSSSMNLKGGKKKSRRQNVGSLELGTSFVDQGKELLSVMSMSFLVTNKPGDGKLFLRKLGKEKQDLAERVMVTRLHLYGRWIKKCNHGEIYQYISDENLELMRERLLETIVWPSDDTNTEKIG